MPLVQQGKGEHPVKAIEARFAPFLPGMDDDLGIAAGAKDMTECRELGHQRLEIVDLAVVDDADRTVLVVDRLVASSQIDDGEPAVTEPDPRRIVETVAIRATMAENVSHATEQAPVGVAAPAIIKDAGYPAHRPDLTLRSQF